MKKHKIRQIHWPAVVFSMFILGAAGAIQMGCSDQLIGLDESALATQQANENIAVQVAKYTEESGSTIDGPIIAKRPVDVSDSLPSITPPLSALDSLKSGTKNGLDTIKTIRKGLEDEMNVVLSLCGRDTVNIGTAGGTISLSGLSGRGKLKFPVDALKKTEEITVVSCNSIAEDLLLYEFVCGPGGTRFEKAIELELSATLFMSMYDKLPTKGAWMYLDEQKNEWTILGEVQVSSDGNFHIPIEHFSTYRMVVTPAVALSQGGQN